MNNALIIGWLIFLEPSNLPVSVPSQQPGPSNPPVYVASQQPRPSKPPVFIPPMQSDPNADPLEYLHYWINVVVTNNSLRQSSATQSNLNPQNSTQNFRVSPSTQASALRAAAVRPYFPLHATVPYTRNAPNVSSSRDLIRFAKSLLDVTNAEPLFYVGTYLLLS